MKKHFIYFLSIGILFAVSFVVSCSTEKDAWLNRTYHNTTAHYNGYFNAGEIIKESMQDFKAGHVENYTEVLPVFVYPNDEESKNLYAPMDTAVSKCETVIARNSMPKLKTGQYRRTEWCKWIDDNWFVIGKAQFLKRDFAGAMEKFNYIAKQYKTEPISYRAKLWKAKTLIELERYDEAEEILEKLLETEELLKEQAEEAKKQKKEAKEKAKKQKSRSSSKRKKKKKKKKKSKKKEKDEIPPLPKNFDRELLPVFADLYLRQKDYEKAEDYLRQSIEVTKKRTFKTRLIFILAQILQKEGSNEASNLYAEVVKRNPVYDMAFQAKINRALAYSGGNSKSIKSQLLKMLKDDKNVDYLDQIYYALGDIELREGNRPKGISYLEKSLMASKANKAQKSKTFLRLGKLFYEEKDYVKAQQYYDSTMSVLPKEHKNYEDIATISNSLTELVKHLNAIQKGDSLTQICSMSEKEVLAKINDIIEQKRLEKEAEKERQEALLASQTSSLPNNVKPSGRFWAYDENIRKMGYQEFRTVWGERPLEDNWRRSDKSSSEIEDEAITEEKVDEELTPEFYLKSLPCNDKNKMDTYINNVKTSLYEAGVIYKTKLHDVTQAKKSFEELVTRFLPDEEAVAGLYQLYLLTSGEEKEKYKQKLLNDYPNSDFAKIIRDPSFKHKEELEKNKAEEEYKKAYTYYANGNYDGAIRLSNKALSKEANPLQCKYYYLRAVATAQKYAGTDSLSLIENALTDVTKHCKGNEVYAPAKSLLDKLRNVQSVADATSGKNTYIYDSDASHFFVLVFPSGSGSINKTKAKIADFNTASFSAKNLKTSSSYVDQKTQVIVVKWFKNKDEAMDYYTAFKVNKSTLPPLNKDYQYFVIAEKNFATLYVEKDINKYIEFFEKNYLE